MCGQTLLFIVIANCAILLLLVLLLLLIRFLSRLEIQSSSCYTGAKARCTKAVEVLKLTCKVRSNTSCLPE